MAESEEKSREEKYAHFANKYQIMVEDENGKRCAMQHPFDTVEEAKEEIGPIHQRHPERTIMHNDEVYMTWNQLRIYKRLDVYPYKCDYDTVYYEEVTP
tara:strand:- start:649 stop:945 length:297 start_codon:yes stop_codon:yes gene_type:complete